ncbi:MAG TPA: FkbM family methyltransferase [Azospirillaceae bacterium]|nr:FkbM family methyltransferase [Azospirillaceae bacterium]
MLDITSAYGLNFWFPSHDSAVGRCLREAGEFARAELDFIVDSLKAAPSGAFLDVGANIGSIGLPAARSLPRTTVWAFEPNPGVFQLLAANTVQNRLGNVVLRQCCVGAQAGVVRFPAPPLDRPLNFGAVGLGDQSKETVPCLMVTLDELAVPDVRFIKIDCEGFDLEVIQGARRTIAEQRPTLLFEGKPGAKTQAAITLLTELGYRCHWFYAPFVSGNNAKGVTVDVGNWAGDINVVAVPMGSATAWPLPAVTAPDEDWKLRSQDFGYLARYKG